MTMHKDLDEAMRATVEAWAEAEAQATVEAWVTVEAWAYAEAEGIHSRGQSLALAREAWIKAFDRAAAELDAG
jgi:hypothetical protein